MRASVMVHLPALERSGYLRSLINSAYKLGITIRGTYGEGTSAEGSFYQISNQLSLGLSEKQVRDNLAAGGAAVGRRGAPPARPVLRRGPPGL